MSQKYTLKKPIQFGSEEITELTFREATAKDLANITPGENPTFGVLTSLAARLSGQPPTALDGLGMGDLMEVLRISGEQLGEFLATGETS